MSRQCHLTISEATIHCVQNFRRGNNEIQSGNGYNTDGPQKRTSTADSPSIHKNDQFQFEEQFARFRIWAGSLGVFAGGRASADKRLQDDSDIKDVILRLLNRLSEKVESLFQADSLSDSEATSNESDADSSIVSVSSLELSEEEDPPEDMAENEPPNQPNKKIAEIADIITRLYKFTAFIRKAGSTKDDGRASRWAESEGLQHEGELEELANHVRWQLRVRYKRIVEHYPILEARIVQTILQRRKRLLYRASHQSKLEKGMEDWLAPTTNESVLEGYQRRPKLHPSGKADHDEQTAVGVPEDIAKARKGKAVTFIETIQTKATTMDRSGFSSYAKSAVLSIISPSAILDLEHLDVPPPPKPATPGIPEAICPYCNQPLGLQIIGQGNIARWKKHLLRDIEPYICLFDGCETPGQQFKSKEEWIHHMAWGHAKIWPCPGLDHQHQVFATPESLKSHITAEHPDTNEDNFDVLVGKAAKLAPDVLAVYAIRHGTQDSQGRRTACPFCDDPSVSFEILEDGVLASFSAESSKKIRAHIGRHLEALALLSLPAQEDLDEEDSDSSNTGGSMPIRSYGSLSASINFSDEHQTADVDALESARQSENPIGEAYGELPLSNSESSEEKPPMERITKAAEEMTPHAIELPDVITDDDREDLKNDARGRSTNYKAPQVDDESESSTTGRGYDSMAAIPEIEDSEDMKLPKIIDLDPEMGRMQQAKLDIREEIRILKEEANMLEKQKRVWETDQKDREASQNALEAEQVQRFREFRAEFTKADEEFILAESWRIPPESFNGTTYFAMPNGVFYNAGTVMRNSTISPTPPLRNTFLRGSSYTSHNSGGGNGAGGPTGGSAGVSSPSQGDSTFFSGLNGHLPRPGPFDADEGLGHKSPDDSVGPVIGDARNKRPWAGIAESPRETSPVSDDRATTPSQTQPPPPASSRQTEVVETPLPVTLEEVFRGTKRKVRVEREVFDEWLGGTRREVKNLSVPIKMGLKPGSKINFARAGNQRADGVAQDICFIIEDKPHPLFLRDGSDLRTTIEISNAEALIGWRRDVRTICGRRVVVRGPRHTQDGWTRRFADYGMPRSSDPSKRGDLIVEVAVKPVVEHSGVV